MFVTKHWSLMALLGRWFAAGERAQGREGRGLAAFAPGGPGLGSVLGPNTRRFVRGTARGLRSRYFLLF